MKVLVTGGAGFIGSHLVDCYVDQGYDVIVVDNLSTGQYSNVNHKAKFIQISLSDLALDKLIAREKPDIISHHAAQVNVRKSVLDPMSDLDINLNSTVRLFKCAGQVGVKKVIYASSGGTVYGETPKVPIMESHNGVPVSPYGINKLAAEFYLFFFAKKFGYHATILRYANVYGPRQNPHGECGIISIFIENMLNNANSRIFGDGNQIRDYVHIHDVVSANMLISDLKDEWNQIFNVGSGKGTSINELVTILKNKVAVPFSPIYDSPVVGDLAYNVLSIDKLKSYGWTPTIDLHKGLDDLLRELNLFPRK